ncbi:hypothetical protein [Budvicia aquatica]|nr:hypothetical protein [Budvicia aquatica]
MVDMLSCSLGMSSACERAYPTPEQHLTALGINIAVIGGYQIIAATPEILAIARAAVEGCKVNPVYCLNQTGIFTAEAVAPGGVGAAGTFVVGNSASELSALKNAVGSKVIIGPWSNGVSNVVKGEVFTQCANGSCVSATGQVLTNGSVSEAQLLKMLGECSNPEALAKALTKTTNVKWVGGYFETSEQALQVAQRGRFGAVLQAPRSPAHMVTIEPIPNSTGTFKVYDTGAGATYEVSSDWIKKYVSGGVWE